jgi:uncharacterized protein DUF4168
LNPPAAAALRCKWLAIRRDWKGNAMTTWKSIVMAGLLCAGPYAVAQTTAPDSSPPGPGTSQLSETTIQKAGLALRDVTQIKVDYSQRVGAVQNPGERQRLAQDAQERQIKAVTDRGLSLSQFNQVVQLAQVDPNVKERLLTAAEGR